VFKTNPQAS